ncbi:glycosyltransferase [Nafulsella turpanensis]|uniref:glycosyltransferase n=1 Tax=Nafulsella turpanensis TaxID=1265690 RepID=UPI00034D73D0|nr:glycosyltransferase [Nafulsella turpanensis]
MNIGLIYTKFYPLTSSASVHGYQLVTNFKKLGYQVNTIGVGKNELTRDFPKSPSGIVNFYNNSDVIYIRLNPWLKNDWFTLIKLLSLGKKKIVWEVNSPSEEALANYDPSRIPLSVKKWVKTQNNKRKSLAKLCDLSISVSEALQKDMKERFKVQNSHYIPNGSDPELFKPKVKDENNPLAGMTAGKFVVVWAGNAAFKWQGTSLIGEVAAKMKGIDRDVVFLYISNVSIYNQVVLPNLISLGEINYLKLPDFLNFADVALCLYNRFNWSPIGFYNSPLKMYDFMAMELPIIGTNMGQIAEVIEDGKNGFLTSNSVNEIIEQILFLKNNAEEREQIGKAARNAIISKYNWKETARRTIQLIEDLF